MKLECALAPLADAEGDVLLVERFRGERGLPPVLARLDGTLATHLSKALAEEGFEGKVGDTAYFHTLGRLKVTRVVVVGLGERSKLDLEAIRKAASAGAKRARDLGAKTVAAGLLGEGGNMPARGRAQALAEGILLGCYGFTKYKTAQKNGKQIETVRILVRDRRTLAQAREGLRVGSILAEATSLARDLINEPANSVTAARLAQVAQEIARGGKLTVKIYDTAQCEAMGMGAFLAVTRGSQHPAKFIHLTYKPARRARRRVALIGKGITFDSGGLDLKSAEAMERMKDDMSGAAAVLGVMQALPRLGIRVEVHGLIAATDNMPSGSAYRPGDILRAMNGKTIEVHNTDAEGRLTLADALAYANLRVKPDEIVDIATLTGACTIALGQICSGVMGNHERLEARVLKAAAEAGEKMWRLPLFEEYLEGLKSEIADLRNTGPRAGGALTAGLFLKEFAGTTPWVHLDIAGPAFTEKDLPYAPKGGTGTGVRTLLTYLMSLSGRR